MVFPKRMLAAILSVFFTISVLCPAAAVSASESKPSYNIFSKQYGAFTNENVIDQQLPTKIYDKLKSEIMAMGVTSYWSDHILQNIAGLEGKDIGAAIVDKIPGSSIFGDSLKKKLNEIINSEPYEDIDLTANPIEPVNRLEGFKTSFEVPIKKDTPFQGDVLLTLKNKIEAGGRDDISFVVEYQTLDGKYHSVPSSQMLTSKENSLNVYEMVLYGITYDKVKSIRLTYNNKFDLPTQPSKLIATYFQKGLNDLAKPLSPISNKARDDIEKVLADGGLDEFCGNGDYGKIIAERIITLIPGVGAAIKLGGFTDQAAQIINAILKFEDVISKAKIAETNMTIRQLSASDFPDRGTMTFEDSKFGDTETDRWTFYSYASNTKYGPAVLDFAKGSEQKLEKVLGLFDNAKEGGPKGIIKTSYSSDLEFSSEVYIGRSLDGNDSSLFYAGLVFRVSNPELGKNSFDGYFCGLSDNLDVAVVGRYENKVWVPLKSIPFKVDSSKWYNLKVKAVGSDISFYVDNFHTPIITVKDSTYKDGFAGIRHYSADANKNAYFDNIIINKIDSSKGQAYEQAFDHVASAYGGTPGAWDKVTAKVDIDGNGKVDTISYELQASITAYIKVNSFNYYQYDKPKSNKFWIIDIDPKDKYKEIVVDVSGVRSTSSNLVILANINDSYRLRNVTYGMSFSKIISLGDGMVTAVQNGETKKFKLNQEHVLEDINKVPEKEPEPEKSPIPSPSTSPVLGASFDGASDWALPELKEAYDLGLCTNKVLANYKSNITRAEFAGLAVKLYEGLTGEMAFPAGANTFSDTLDIDVRKAYALKIVGGVGNGRFAPNEQITREQLAVMYYNAIRAAYGKIGKTMPKSDGVLTIKDKAKVADWARIQVDFVFDQGIITGDGVTYNPKGNASREAAIAVVKRVYKKYMRDFGL